MTTAEFSGSDSGFGPAPAAATERLVFSLATLDANLAFTTTLDPVLAFPDTTLERAAIFGATLG
jgi:hypothetical protein